MVIVTLQDRNISRVDVAALQLSLDTHTLDLSCNRIVKIDTLDALSTLQVLNLSFNRLVKLEGLGRLRLLHTVNVSNNSLRDFGCLAQCFSLQELYVLCHLSCVCSEMTPFSCMPELTPLITRGDLAVKTVLVL
jgi:Leucine-rich repeat (LRR) protein